jgi:ubiquinone/menaquinone biosynthesis C-methylase UbiE
MTVYNLDSPTLATTYDVLSNSQFVRGSELVDRLDIQANHVVLDIGAGTGRLGLHVLEKKLDIDGKLIGIDPLEERIKVAKAKNRYANGEFLVGTAEDLSFLERESVDHVYLSSVFHWVPDKKKALAEIFRVLKPGGKVGITTGARELSDSTTIHKVLNQILLGPKYSNRVNIHDYVTSRQGTTTTELINLLSEAGFEVESVEVHRNQTRHESGEVFVDFLESSTFGNYLAHVPEDLRPAARAEFVEALELLNHGNGIESIGHGISAIAQKPAPIKRRPIGCEGCTGCSQ